ncbi:MAG: hypothetical protein H0V12_07025 [Chloroflexi bacterium]|nr:hypothetical protein [Chloroflexota bacterium]
MLFSLLLWAERRLVLREVATQVRAAVEDLRFDEEQVKGLAEDPDSATLTQRFSDQGQVGVVYDFLSASRVDGTRTLGG